MGAHHTNPLAILARNGQAPPRPALAGGADLQQQMIVAHLRKMVCPTCGKTGAEVNVHLQAVGPGQTRPLCLECFNAALFALCPPMYMPGGENDPNVTTEAPDG